MSLCLNAPTIGYDTLVEVIDVLADEGDDECRDTIVALSQTCRYLRAEGSRRLLSRPVRVNLIRQPRLVAAFCHFMLGDPTVRSPFLRRLAVDVYDLKEDVSRRLADVLALSCCLEDLHIDSLFKVTKPVLAIICSAISSLTSLRHFSVKWCNGDDSSYYQIFYDALRAIRSPLTTAQVAVPSIKLPSSYILYMRVRDPIFLLSKSSSSLRRVEVDGIIKVGGGIRVYPLVEELAISDYLEGMPDLRTYLLCFPNIQHLRCGSAGIGWFRHRHDADILQESCCDATVQQWHDYNKRGSARQDHAWKMLRSFRGSIIDAYVLALPCRGLRLHLMSTGGRRSAEYAMLSTILSDIRPSSLRFSLKVHDGRGYIPILPPHSLTGWATNLRTLEIRINIVKQFFDLDECFSHVVDMLRAMSVTSFQLEIRCANMDTQYGEILETPSESEDGVKCRDPLDYTDGICYAQNTLLQEDLHQRVRDILSITPTLRQVTVMWARCYAEVPVRIVGIDKDNFPHSFDRPGGESDGWRREVVDW
ncbi:hypothetical protein K466DRAFT_597157 [Polyporus arcularius HHB13444]|uniref:F-box domain-containing protein n=1 Tax=Polyporus arcularius HHB13444 TaxID=1314778 RepID=A0A5C3PLJ2_9APHY|nr:hypothetical protein K466DRAFT_597157 [Polyporus arcularius HHB13444]